MNANTLQTVNGERLPRLPEILALLQISKTAWYDGIKAGMFPSPIKWGKRTARWRESDIVRIMSA
jgi:prophage regulatory protein